MADLGEILQKQLANEIGKKIIISQKTGVEVVGELIEVSSNHITLKRASGRKTVLIDMIGGWEILGEETTSTEQGTPSTTTEVTSVKVTSNPSPLKPSDNTSHPNSFDEEIYGRLAYIEGFVAGKIRGASLKVQVPDFTISDEELKGAAQNEIAREWQRVKQKYEYGANRNELGSQFGRIQPTINYLKVLVGQAPFSPGLRRHLAYFQFIAASVQEAIKTYVEAGVLSNAPDDWYNVAFLSLQVQPNDEIAASHALGRVFHSSSLTNHLDGWYCYIGLLQNSGNCALLRELYHTTARTITIKEEEYILLAAIYLLKCISREEVARVLVRGILRGKSNHELLQEAMRHMPQQTSHHYQQYELSIHEIQQKLLPASKVVAHDTIPTPKHIAPIHTSSPTTGTSDINKIFELATSYANEGDYVKAVTQIKKVLTSDPTHPEARSLYENWKRYTRIVALPRGSTPYPRAKRVQMIENDREGAIRLFYEAIRQNDNTESAIKDLAALLMQERPHEAVQVLEQNRDKINDKQPIDNLLINAYQKAGQYPQAVELLLRNLRNTSYNKNKQANIKWQIASCYLRQEDFIRAEEWFRQVVKLGLNIKAAQRNIAVCLIKRQRYDDAEELLTINMPDVQSAQLLEGIAEARITGQFNMRWLADFSSAVTPFTRFFLDRCNYRGVPSNHVQEKTFEPDDVHRLDELAKTASTRRPRERADYYLSAAKIILEHDEWEDEYKKRYRYLCRSFASRGDAAVIDHEPLDSAREWYCEALIVYDNDGNQGKYDEQDPVNALVRFLFATLGRDAVPISQTGFDNYNLAINDNLEKILQDVTQRKKVFDAIAYLVIHSHFAADRILPKLYTSFQEISLVYLRNKGLAIPEVMTVDKFKTMWKDLQLEERQKARTTSLEFRSIDEKIEFKTSSIEACLQQLQAVEHVLLFDLDRQRLGELQKVLEKMLELCRQFAFEELELFCKQIKGRCKDLLKEIEDYPTILSVGDLYPIVTTINEKATAYLEEIYNSSIPQLTLHIPESMDSYGLNAIQPVIEVEIVIENRMGCSPAEALEVIVQEDDQFFTVEEREFKLNGSLRGGEQRIVSIPIRITEQAVQSQAFSLPGYVQYRTRSGETLQTPAFGFSINLYPAEQFKRIDNPYENYEKGGPVENTDMFKGRDELITNIAEAICNADSKSKSIMVYGQKRSGKTSILHHLKLKLEQKNHLLVLNLGSVGGFLDSKSATPLLYQFLYEILLKLTYAIEDEVDKGRPPLDVTFPVSEIFYNHPTPLRYFQELLTKFRRTTKRVEAWQDVGIVLLFDEFSYLYALILNGDLSNEFFKNWKGILQENLFSTVLAGQDVMPKFKGHFANEFNVIEDQRVSYLLREDAIALIVDPIRIGGPSGDTRYRERAIDRILDLTAGSPYYIQIICSCLVKYMNRKQKKLVTQADVEQVKRELFEGNNSLDWTHFDNLTNSGDTSPTAISEKDARTVLISIADHSRSGPCRLNSIDVETQTDVGVILAELVSREVIEVKQGQYYTIKVGLFKEWLLAH